MREVAGLGFRALSKSISAGIAAAGVLVFGLSGELSASDLKPASPASAEQQDGPIIQEKASTSDAASFVLPEDQQTMEPADAQGSVGPSLEESSRVDVISFRVDDQVDLVGDGGSGDGEPLAGQDDSPADEKIAPYGGYYPTGEEWESLYQPGNRTDPRKIKPAGLWNWQQNDNDFYSRHENFFRPVDRVFGILQSDTRESFSYGTYRHGFEPTWTGAVDASIPHFFREFAEEEAMLRLGPIYLDLLEISGTLLYSDYTGPEDFPDGEEDGWLSIVSLTIRGAVKITNNLYIATTVTPYWLPQSGDWGFAVGYGDGLGFNLGTGLGLAYEREFGRWIVTFDDALSVNDITGNYWGNWDISDNAFERAGRYEFGSQDDRNRGKGQRGSDFWDSENVYLSNSAILQAETYMTPLWILNLSLERDDTWYFDGLEHTGANNIARATYLYDGQDMRLAPFFTYAISTGGESEWEIFNNEFSMGLVGPITQNLRMRADLGYYWRYGASDEVGDNGEEFQTLTYNLSLIHEFGPYTTQMLSGGNDVYYDDFDGETISKYLTYRIDQSIGHRTEVFFFSTGSEEEALDEDEGVSHNWAIGGGINYGLGSYSTLFGSVVFERIDPESGIETERWLYQAGISHRIAPSLTGTFEYRYEDYSEEGDDGNFDEHLFIMTLTKGF